MPTKIAAAPNKDKKWNEAPQYFPIYLDNGESCEWYMFTKAQLEVAGARAKRNPEDIPVIESNKSLLGRIFGWLK